MTTITRKRLEWLCNFSGREEMEDIDGSEIKELAQLALASLDAEKVILYRERNSYNGMTTGWQELTDQEYEFVKDNASENAEFKTVYIAQPAAVVPHYVIGWLRSDYNSDEPRDPNPPLFMIGANDPSETWGVKYIPLTEISQAVTDREQVRREHAEWSDKTFGKVGPVGPLKHLSKEALEAAAEPGDLSEWADMQFLYWDAQRRAGISDWEIIAAMEKKLKVNMARQWPEPKDGEPRLHIKEPGNSPVIPDGYVLAPIKPTPEMLRAGFLVGEDYPGGVYRAMLSAIQQQEVK